MQFPACRADKYRLTGLIPFNAIALFMDHAMVVPAKQYQVVQAGFPSVAPMVNMVGIHISGLTATGKAATLVSNR